MLPLIANIMSLIYKACQNSIVTLELLPDSITNERRSDVANCDFAKFRTNKALVISIVDPISNKEMNMDCSIYDPNFAYRVAHVVEPDYNRVRDIGFGYYNIRIFNYDSDINNVCSMGIHYFKTYEAALSWYYQYHPKTNGKYIEYYDNGQKKCEKDYKNGQKNGKQKKWYHNGHQKYNEWLNYQY